jgi:hypothetical protein
MTGTYLGKKGGGGEVEERRRRGEMMCSKWEEQVTM